METQSTPGLGTRTAIYIYPTAETLLLLYSDTRKSSQLELHVNVDWRTPATSVRELLREQEEEAAVSDYLDLFHRYCNYKQHSFANQSVVS